MITSRRVAIIELRARRMDGWMDADAVLSRQKAHSVSPSGRRKEKQQQRCRPPPGARAASSRRRRPPVSSPRRAPGARRSPGAAPFFPVSMVSRPRRRRHRPLRSWLGASPPRPRLAYPVTCYRQVYLLNGGMRNRCAITWLQLTTQQKQVTLINLQRL